MNPKLMKSTLRQSSAFVVFVLASALPGPVSAQVSYTLQHSITPAAVRVQSGSGFGTSVAMDGGFTAVGAPNADTSALNSGAVKVFDSTTVSLLFVLARPVPATGERFGGAVGISGTRVVVGADADQTTGPGSAYVYDLGSATPTVAIATLNNPSPAAGDLFGRSVSISGTRVVVGASRDDTGATDAGSAYVYDLSSATPAVPVATLNNPGPEVNDSFGFSVAISGTLVVVAAVLDDTGATNAGSAYVYDLSSATPAVPVRTLNNPGPAMGDSFGWSVAISGTRVVVGAFSDDTGAANAGSAYVYDLSSGTPAVPVATLDNPGPAVGDAFGNAVAISGTRVVVAAFSDDTGVTNAGSAYVYELSGATPTVPLATLNNPGPAQSISFGRSMAISGTRVAAGAGSNAYVYELNGVTPAMPSATLSNAGPSADDLFGNAVAISGTRLVVGALRDDTGAEDAGSAYVYDLSSGAPTVPVAILHNPVPVRSDYFGNTVAISGTRVVIGASADGTSQGDAGSAYVYDLSSPTPAAPVLTLDNPGLPGSHLFGSSVGIAGTLVLVGASFDDTGASGAGRAYVYDLNSATPSVPVLALDNPNPAQNDQFGNAVAISGMRVVVGARWADTGAADAGRVYVFDLSSATPTEPIATLNNPTPTSTEEFGYSVAISGTRVVVGTPEDDTGANDAGIAYVYDLSSATPRLPIATLNNPSPADGDFFGISVAIFGTRVVVGARQDDTGADNAGTAYVYDLTSSPPTVPVATINNPHPAAGDNFALSVAIDGANIAIGTPFAESPLADVGTTYVFSSDADGDGLLDSWEIARFGTTTGHSALDDTDGDGRNELLEEAFDTNPLVPDANAAPAAVNEGGYLTLTIAKHSGVSYQVQSAGTLLPALPDSFSSVMTTVLIDNFTTLKVRDNVLIGTTPARFMRTKVTAAP